MLNQGKSCLAVFVLVSSHAFEEIIFYSNALSLFFIRCKLSLIFFHADHAIFKFVLLIFVLVLACNFCHKPVQKPLVSVETSGTACRWDMKQGPSAVAHCTACRWNMTQGPSAVAHCTACRWDMTQGPSAMAHCTACRRDMTQGPSAVAHCTACRWGMTQGPSVGAFISAHLLALLKCPIHGVFKIVNR